MVKLYKTLGIALGICLLPFSSFAKETESIQYSYSELMEKFASQSTVVEKMTLDNEDEKEYLTQAAKQYKILNGTIKIRLDTRDNLDRSIELSFEDKKKADVMTVTSRAYEDYYYKSTIKQSLAGYLNFAIADYQNNLFDKKAQHEKRKAEQKFKELLVEYESALKSMDYLNAKQTYLKESLEELKLKYNKGLISRDLLYGEELKLLNLTLDFNKASNKKESLFKEIITTLKLPNTSVLNLEDFEMEKMNPLSQEIFNSITLKSNSELNMLKFQLDIIDKIDGMAKEAFKPEELEKKILLLENEKKRIDLKTNLSNIKIGLQQKQREYELACVQLELAKDSYSINKEYYQVALNKHKLEQLSQQELNKAKLDLLKGELDYSDAYRSYLSVYHQYENVIYGYFN